MERTQTEGKQKVSGERQIARWVIGKLAENCPLEAAFPKCGIKR